MVIATAPDLPTHPHPHNRAHIGWLTRNDMLAGVKATLGEWEAEIASIDRSLAKYAPVVLRLQAHLRREEKAESWEKLAWLRAQAHLKRHTQEQQLEQEKTAVHGQEQVQLQGQDEECGEEAAAVVGEEIAPVAHQMEGVEREQEEDKSLRIRVLYDEGQGLDGVERVLQGMVAYKGGIAELALKVELCSVCFASLVLRAPQQTFRNPYVRSTKPQDYMAEQEAVEKGQRPAKAAPSMGSVLATGSLDPRDVVEMNLQALGALVLGPFKTIGWSFKVCLEELYAAVGWNWKYPFRQHTFHSSRHLDSAAEQGAVAWPLSRWWRETVAPTTVGWVFTSFLQGPDAAMALLWCVVESFFDPFVVELQKIIGFAQPFSSHHIVLVPFPSIK